MDILKESQVDLIVEKTEEILEDTGFIVENEEILKISKQNGAVVDETSGIVKLPRKLLRELLSLCPSEYSISDLKGNECTVGGDNRYCMAIVTDPWIIDYKTRLPRRPSLEDIRRNTIVGQSLPDVISMSRMDFPVTDFSDQTSSWHALLQHLIHQDKHITFIPGSLEQYRIFVQIAEILKEGIPEEKNILSVAVTPISPLKLSGWNAEVLVDVCKRNIPLVTTTCPMAGMTSPYSRIGTFLQANVETIFLITVSQMLKPGIPFRYSFGSSVMDVKTGCDRYYTMEKVLEKLVIGSLARRYKIPYGVECGGTMRYHFDGQSGAEGVLFMLTAYLSGANILQGIGSCYNAIGMSPEMMIIQAGWFKVAKYLSKGVNFDQLQESVESIKNAGPGGNFLTDSITIKNLRTDEFFNCELFGEIEGKTMFEKAHDKVEEIISNFRSPLNDEKREKLVKYFSDKIFMKAGR
ncbi:MAG: trimethylamine methyltransferase family protein [Candidatus Omnitrophica bacterium]|nr:trimethylamine methyltransferase family protein [Candidatus Omnitrophota bacterium]